MPPADNLAEVSRDSDGDNWTDRLETLLGSDPQRSDSDGDGMADPVDGVPMCHGSALTSSAKALAAWMRWRFNPKPLRLATGQACANGVTLGGAILPARADAFGQVSTELSHAEAWMVHVTATDGESDDRMVVTLHRGLAMPTGLLQGGRR